MAGYGNFTVARVADGIDGSKPAVDLTLVHFSDTAGAPSQAVSQMAKMAVSEGADYIYQLNDDTILVSKDWLVTVWKSKRCLRSVRSMAWSFHAIDATLSRSCVRSMAWMFTKISA